MKRALMFFCLFIAGTISAQNDQLTYIHLKKTGVEDFLKKHPSFDGRGTLVFILDTGVDVGTDGLLTTSLNETKVISVSDLSGQGDVKLTKAVLKKTENGTSAFKGGNEFLSGIETLTGIDTSNILIGSFDESRLMNTAPVLRDINGNNNYNDKFGIAVFYSISDNKWKYAVDINADQSITGDKVLESYNSSQNYFSIPNTDTLPLMNIAVNLYPDKGIANLFFDDNSHGTHVAGISAGYKISKADFNGVAPGAKLAAYKISDNSIGGGISVTGAMRKAYIEIDSIARNTGNICIVNMSFGIGSELEGFSDMELFLDSLLSANPYMYVFLSAGNEGPGLSSIGLPATSRNAFSTGAVLMQDIANDQYFSPLEYDIVLHFSSRGGEFPKPDAIAPGACISTVPQFANPRKWGTSMASPYTAGAASLLLSAFNQEMPEVKIPSVLLYKALKESAIPYEGYNYLDQGKGLINVERAYSLLKEYISSEENVKLAEYNLRPIKPAPDGRAANIFIRDFNHYDETGEFEFEMNKSGGEDESHNPGIFYNLTSDSKWLKPKSGKLIHSNNSPLAIALEYEKDDMEESGLAVGNISAFIEGKNIPEFDMTVAAVLPYEFTEDNDYEEEFTEEIVSPGIAKRYYFRIPNESGLINVNLASSEGKYCNVVYRLFDPTGIGIDAAQFTGKDSIDNELNKSYARLMPGVYEIIIYGNFMGMGDSEYDLSLNYYGVQAAGGKDFASVSNNELELKNFYEEEFEGTSNAQIIGYRKEFVLQLDEKGRAEYEFYLTKNLKGKKFNISYNKKDYSKFTDIGLQILDMNDSALVNEAAHHAEEMLAIKNDFNEDSVKLKLVITGGFAIRNQTVKFTAAESSVFNDEDRIPVEMNNDVFVDAKNKTLLKMNFSKNIDRPIAAQLYGIFTLQLKNHPEVEWRIPFLINQ